MKTRVAIAAVLLCAGLCWAGPLPPLLYSGFLVTNTATAGGGGGGGAAFSDDFNRTDSASLGANWTEAAGDASISGNAYLLVTSGFGVITSVHNTSTGTTSQYVKATLSGADVVYPWFVFRYVDSSSGYYAVQFGSTGSIEWYYFANAADTTGDLIGSGTIGSDLTGQTVGMTITGTGASTVLRVWLNPTNLPNPADNWDGDTTPNVTLTDDPATPCDTGTKVGLGGQQNGNTVKFDNFFGGGL